MNLIKWSFVVQFFAKIYFDFTDRKRNNRQLWQLGQDWIFTQMNPFKCSFVSIKYGKNVYVIIILRLHQIATNNEHAREWNL